MLLVMLLCGITAAWGAQQVIVSPTSNGQVTFSPEAPTAGQTVVITVTPNQGYCIHKSDIVVKKTIDAGSAQGPARIGIAGDIEISGDEPTDHTVEARYIFTMPEAPYGARIDATFPEAPTFNVTTGNCEHGRVTSDLSQAKKGDLVSLTAYPEEGYKLTEFIVTCGNGLIEIQNGNQFIMPYGDVNVTATFEAVTYGIDKAFGITDGDITINKTEAHKGDKVSVTVTPDTGYEVDDIYIEYETEHGVLNQSLEHDQDGYYFTMPAYNVTVYATFKPTEYNVTIAPSENGAILIYRDGGLVSSGIKAQYKDLIRLDVNPKDHYKAAEVKFTYIGEQGDLVTTTITPDENGVYQFRMPAADVTVSAIFEQLPYNITVAETQHGTLSIFDDKTTATPGEQVGVRATPETGYEVENVQISYETKEGKISVDTELDQYGYYNFEMPAADVTVSATFKATEYNVNVAPSENGTVTASKQKAAYGDEIVLTVTPNDHCKVTEVKYTFYAGGQSDILKTITPDENGVYKFTMPNADVTVSATFEQLPYNITVNEAQNGQVAADKQTAQMGEEVTLTVTPAAGYELDALKVMAGNNEVTVTDGKFTMPAADVTVTATFKRNLFNITVAETQHGTLSISGNKTTAIVGEQVGVRATPETGYEVDNIHISYETEEGEMLVDAVLDQYGYYNFNMPAADVTVYGIFKVTEYNVNVIPSENGTVTASKQKAAYGDEIVLTVTPNNNCKVTEVKYVFYAGGQSDMMYTVSPDENGVYKFTMPNADVTVSATFERLSSKYNITVAETQNGTVTVKDDKQTADPSEQISVYGQPEAGYEVGEVKVTYTEGNELKQIETTQDDYGFYNFTMPAADVTITVTFVKKAYTVEVAQTENGTVTVDKTTANAGDEINVTITPAVGYEVDDISFHYELSNQPFMQTIENGKFTMPNADVIVRATFKALPPFNITVAETQNGSVSILDDKTTANVGEQVSVYAKPEPGYQVGEVKVTYTEGNEQKQVETTQDDYGFYNFNMPAADVTIAVTFVMKEYTVAVGPTENGTVTVDKTTAYAGDVINVTITPAAGYEVDELSYHYELSNQPFMGTIVDGKFTMPNADVTVRATFKALPVKKYNITVLETENGTAEVDKAQAAIGETVTITVTPAQGYELDQLTVSASYEIQGGGGEEPRAPRKMRADQGNITVTKVDDTHYTFVLPESLPNFLTPNYADNTEFQVKATFKKVKVLTPLHTILTEGVDGNDYTVAEAMAVVKVLGGDAYVTDGTDYIRLQLNDAIAEQLIEGNKSLEGTVTGKLDLRDTNPVLVVSELSENAVENDGISTAIQSVDMSQGMVPQVKLAQVVRMSGYWDGNALRAYSAAPQGQSLIITNNHMPANWQVGGNYTVTVAIYLNEAWEAEQPAGGAPRRVKAGDDLDFQNLRGELINLEITTAIDTLLMDSNVADVHYVNVAGQVSDRPFEGINIMVMKLNDGTTRTVKVVK